MSRTDRRAKQRAQAKRQQQLRARQAQGQILIPPKVSRIIALVALGLVVVGAGLWWFINWRKGNVVLNTVNGVNITQADLNHRVGLYRFLNGLTGEVSADTRKALLDTMINDQLVVADAQSRGLTVSDQELADLTASWAGSLGYIYGSKIQITVAQVRNGVSQSALTDYQRIQIYTEKLYNAVTADVTVTDADIEALYQQYKETLDQQGLSLEQARDTLRQDALTQKRGDVYTQYVNDLRSKATVTGPGLGG